MDLNQDCYELPSEKANENFDDNDWNDDSKIVDYVLVYSKQKNDDDVDEENVDSSGKRMKKSEAKAKAKRIFLANLRTAGLLIKKVDLFEALTWDFFKVGKWT